MRQAFHLEQIWAARCCTPRRVGHSNGLIKRRQPMLPLVLRRRSKISPWHPAWEVPGGLGRAGNGGQGATASLAFTARTAL